MTVIDVRLFVCSWCVVFPLTDGSVRRAAKETCPFWHALPRVPFVVCESYVVQDVSAVRFVACDVWFRGTRCEEDVYFFGSRSSVSHGIN